MGRGLGRQGRAWVRGREGEGGETYSEYGEFKMAPKSRVHELL